MNNPKISLVIPAYNEEKYIGDCLDYAIKNSEGRFFEIIVIDNASSDRTAEIAASRPGVRVVREDKKGLTKARQRGLEEASGDFIAYTDADTRLPKKWFETALDVFSKNPKAVCLSGPYIYYDLSGFKNMILTALWWLTAPLTYRIVGYMVLGGNFIAKKSALLAMGGFDTNIEFYGEDTNIARRLSKFGKVIFRMDFTIDSSARRFIHEGMFKVNFLYGINFLWQVAFHRSRTKVYSDIRPNS
jgi:glycosyltransferase involved in cell wall biosynthesis